MACDATGDLIQPPADRLRLMPSPRLWQRMRPEHHEQIVGQHPDAEEHGIGGKLTAGHVLHAKAQLEFLDAVLAVLAPHVIPVHHRCRINRRLAATA